MASIDIGPGAIDRAGANSGNGYTVIEFTNPANDTGILTTMEVWAVSTITGFKMGTFSGSGTSYTYRDHETLGTITSGSKQTFTGLSCSVSSGDYLGFYYVSSSLGLEYDSTGYSGGCYKAGDRMIAEGAQTYTTVSNYAQSVYATGIRTYTHTASVIVGAVASATRIFGRIRSASTLIGAVVSATADYVAGVTNTIVNAAIEIGAAVTASRTWAATRAASVLVGATVTASGLANFIRSASIITGAVSTASRIIGFVRTSYAAATVETLRPNADGTYEQWSLYGEYPAHNYLNVDEAVADDSTSYVGIVLNKSLYDTYNLPDSSVGAGTINSVTVYLRARRGAYDHANLALYQAIITGGTAYLSPSKAAGLTDSWGNYSYTWNTNPNTSAAWTWSDINALQVGMYGVTPNTTGMNLHVTQVYCEVNYDASQPNLITVGANVSASRAWGVLRTASIITGIAVTASRLAAFIRSASVAIGAAVSATANYLSGTGNTVVSAAIEIGAAVTASRIWAATRTGSIIAGATVTASRIVGITRAASTAIGAVVTATRQLGYVRTASVITGVAVTASRLVAWARSAAVAIGLVITARAGAVFYEVAAAIEIGVTVTASRIAGFVRTASVDIGVAVSALRTIAEQILRIYTGLVTRQLTITSSITRQLTITPSCSRELTLTSTITRK
jgi:hypothetical protein